VFALQEIKTCLSGNGDGIRAGAVLCQ
jgi:hypothetical protein